MDGRVTDGQMDRYPMSLRKKKKKQQDRIFDFKDCVLAEILHLSVFGRKGNVKIPVSQPSLHQHEWIGSATPSPGGRVLLPGS